MLMDFMVIPTPHAIKSQISRRSLLQDLVTATSLSTALARSVSAEANDIHAIAEEAYIWGLPLWLQEKYLERSRQDNTPLNRFTLSSELARPEDRNVGPNVDTLYGYAWLDLEAEPVVLFVPDTNDRYYCIQFIDAYSNSFDYVGRRVTGTKEGRYAIAGPGWNGHVPDGIVRLNAPTNRVLALARTLVRGEADLPNARAIQEKITLTPLSSLKNPPQLSLSVVSAIGVFPFLHPGEQGARYLDDLGRYLQADPPPRRENAPLERFASAKIGPGFTPSNSAQHAQYADAVAAADDRVKAANYSSRVNGWKVNYGVTPFITDRLQRAAANRLGPGTHVAEEALYFVATADSKGNPLTGESRYRIQFAPGQFPPVDAFWSLILYGADFFLYKNSLNRYSISDRTEGLLHQPDGSLEISLQHPNPGPSANWLPAPDGNFQLVLRTYQPKPEVLRREWKPPLIEAIS
jgi:hypothetical protein